VAEFCADLRQLCQASGCDLKVLARELKISRSQLGAILNGQIRRPPDWTRLVGPLVAACTKGDASTVARWRQRHAVLVGVWEELSRRERQSSRAESQDEIVLDATGSQPPDLPGAGDGDRPIPRQLPADMSCFVGRSAQLDQLDALLAVASAEQATAVVISALSGTAGVGKTALAIHWAHRVADRFPDGQLYVNLRGFHPSGQVMAPATAVRGFLGALGVPAGRTPADLDAQTALYRSLLTGKRMLVVLDNARDAEQIRPLLPGSAGCLVMVSSRDQLTALMAANGAHSLTVDLLSRVEAHELLARRLGASRVTAEPEAVEQIIGCCARLPLALSIAAARAVQTGFPLTALATELADANQRLDALDAGDAATRLQAVFSWSYQALTPPAARLFRLLGLHPGPDTSVAAAASLAGLPAPQAGRLLAEMTRASLATEHAPGRYGFHDLLTAYAAELAHATDPEPVRRAAVTRLLDHYTHTAHTADRLLDPARDPIPVPLTIPAPGTAAEQLADHQHALDWLTAEHPVLLGALRLAVAAEADTYTWQLAWALDTFLNRRGHWHDEAGAWRAAVTAAGHLTNPAAALAHRNLALAAIELGRYSEASTHLHRALDLDTHANDPAGQAHAHHALGLMWERQDRPDKALGHAEQAFTLYQAAGHFRGQADALNAIGWCHGLLGEHTQALTRCELALTLHQRSGNCDGQAHTWDSLGYAHHHLAQYTQAADCYSRALTLFRELGDRHMEAETLSRLGDTQRAAGELAAARATWSCALRILTDLEHPGTDAIRDKLRDLGAA
jgi:tetratricopeptide (TPR) repeat protein